MAYKAVALRVPTVTDEFTIGSIRLKKQRNGVLACLIRATVQRGFAIRDVNLFANGARLAAILPAIQPALDSGTPIRIQGKWSQRNTMVMLGLQSDMAVPLHSPNLFQ